MAIGTVLKHWRVFPEKGPAPFGMTGVTVFIHAGLFELRRIGRAMWVMAIRTSKFSLPERHVGGTHQLRLSLQVTLAAHLGLRSFIKEWRPVADFSQLITVGGFFHHRVAIDAGYAAAGVGAGFPIGLHSALMAA